MNEVVLPLLFGRNEMVCDYDKEKSGVLFDVYC